MQVRLRPKLIPINPSRVGVISSALVMLLFAGLFYPSGVARAATQKQQKSITYHGITVTPAIIKIDLKPGQPQADFNISVTNNTNQDLDLVVSSVDFKSLNSSGGLAFISSTSSQLNQSHGLASWLQFGVQNIHLIPKQSLSVPVIVQNRADLAPGGHYAAVLFKGEASSTDKGATHVAINQVASSLVFIQKLGGEKFGISLAKPKVPTSWLHLPSSINLFFRNTGNTQEVPYGIVTITDPLGKEVSRGQINTEQSLVLPDSTRLYRTPLLSTGHSWLGGKYKVKVVYHSDGVKFTRTMTSEFMYFNLKFIVLAILIIFVAVIVVRKSSKLLRSRRQKIK